MRRVQVTAGETGRLPGDGNAKVFLRLGLATGSLVLLK